jgi:hypothetical protein
MFFIVVAYIPGVLWKQKIVKGFCDANDIWSIDDGNPIQRRKQRRQAMSEKCEFFSCLLFSGRIQQKDVEFIRVLH